VYVVPPSVNVNPVVAGKPIAVTVTFHVGAGSCLNVANSLTGALGWIVVDALCSCATVVPPAPTLAQSRK